MWSGGRSSLERRVVDRAHSALKPAQCAPLAYDAAMSSLLASLDPTVARMLVVFIEPSTWLLLSLVVAVHILSSYRSTSFSFQAHGELAKETEASLTYYRLLCSCFTRGGLTCTFSVIAIPLVGSVLYDLFVCVLCLWGSQADVTGCCCSSTFLAR